MIIFKTGRLSEREERIIDEILEECDDIYRDFYITRNNLRLFIQENKDLLYLGLRKGDKLIYEENRGFIFITGWSDNKSPRKYVKILAINDHSADRLLKALAWNIKTDLYIKIKKNNPLVAILKRNNYRFIGDRGLEVLLCRKYIPKEIKERNNDR